MWKIRLWKTRLYQGFPGPFWGWAVSFYGLPLFCGNAFHILTCHFWTLCPEVAAYFIMTGGKKWTKIKGIRF